VKGIVSKLTKLKWGQRACVAFALCTATAIALSAQTFTRLHSFDGTDGKKPMAALIQATSGDLYGTTNSGGLGATGIGFGTAFAISPSGTFKTIHGTTTTGGANNLGTVFSLSTGLGPFVETQTASGSVGAAVTILGTDLTGATSVTFDGTIAAFTVVSKSEITTTVPSGAITGTIEVVTPNGTLSSNVPFRVQR
jgi:hypothetical protein